MLTKRHSPSLSVCVCVCLPVCVPVCMSLSLSLCLPACLPVPPPQPSPFCALFTGSTSGESVAKQLQRILGSHSAAEDGDGTSFLGVSGFADAVRDDFQGAKSGVLHDILQDTEHETLATVYIKHNLLPRFETPAPAVEQRCVKDVRRVLTALKKQTSKH